MSTDSPRQSWARALRRCDLLAQGGIGWEGISAYRQIVAQVAESPFAERLYALHSLDFVAASPVSGWPKRESCSSVTLLPFPEGRVRLVLCKRGKGQPDGVEEVVCPVEQAWTQLAPWLPWLQEEAAEPS